MTAINSTIAPVAEFKKRLIELADFLGIENFQEKGEFTGVTLNSRLVVSGDLFIALPGAKVHGANFIDDIIARGAVAVVTDLEGSQIIKGALPVLLLDTPRVWVGPIASWFYGNPFNDLDAVGITGTNGKTTTAALLDQIWRLDGRASGFIGTIGIIGIIRINHYFQIFQYIL